MDLHARLDPKSELSGEYMSLHISLTPSLLNFSNALSNQLNLDHFRVTDFCQILHTVFLQSVNLGKVNALLRYGLRFSQRFKNMFKSFHVVVTYFLSCSRILRPVIAPCKN